MNSTLGRELHEFQDYGVSSIIAIRYRITRVMIHEFMSHDSRFSMLTVAKYVKVQDSFSSVCSLHAWPRPKSWQHKFDTQHNDSSTIQQLFEPLSISLS